MGEAGGDEHPGHIHWAIKVAWQELLGRDGRLWCPEEKAREVFDRAGISQNDRVLAYSRVGARAAVSYLAMKRLGMLCPSPPAIE